MLDMMLLLLLWHWLLLVILRLLDCSDLVDVGCFLDGPRVCESFRAFAISLPLMH